MRPGIWTSYFMDLAPEAMVETFAENGWRTLELSDEHARALLHRGNPETAGNRFRQFAEALGVSFPQGHLWLHCDITAPNQEEVIAQLKTWLDLFSAIGIHAAILHPGNDDQLSQEDKSAVLEAQATALRALTDHVNGADLTICLENLAHSFSQAEDLLHIINATGSDHLGICLDTGHLNIAGGDQAHFIRTAGPLLKALHIADNEGTTDQHLMPYGCGTICWEKMIAALKENAYAGLFDLEIPGERNCPMRVRLAKLDYLKTLTSIMLENLY